MKKTMLFALCALLSINAWSFDNKPATFTWTVGNESAATVVSDAASGVKETKVKVGSGLTVTTANNIGCNTGNTMVLYNPSSNKLGKVSSAMIEYTVKMKKGVTFTLTGLSYDAVKKGTNNAEYHWSYEVDGTASDTILIDKDHLIRDNNTENKPPLHHEEAITAAAGQVVKVRFFVSGFDAGKNFCLSNIVIDGKVNGEEEVRTFKDFKIDFRSAEPTVLLPEGGAQPSNVSYSNLGYKDDQHGLNAGTITVTVDGPVKFTLGTCNWGNTIAVKKGGKDFAVINNNGGCDDKGVNSTFNKNIVWTYNVEEAAELSFTLNSTYLPYMFAEACEFVPEVEVRYFDTDGKKLIGSEIVAGNSELKYKYGAADVTIADGMVFRGWFNDPSLNGVKVPEGTALTEDLSLYAKARVVEVAELGKIFTYDFREASFDPDEHELLTTSGGKYNDKQHGWAFANGNTLSIQVAGNALLSVSVCTYSATGTVEVKDAANNKVGELTVEKEKTGDGSLQTIQYEGPATTLTFYFTATNYIHLVKVYNIAQLPEKNEAGYYEIAPNDAAGFILALETATAGDKIFLPNGTYDLGEATSTTISKNNISVIGQSMKGTIIKNAPDFHKEGLGSSVTILIPISVSGTYFQDLTIQNAMDYYAAIAAGLPGGRGAALQDEGTHTVLKNVRLLSYQDTYYSKKSGAQHYFEDCEIHGTVDFICGAASVYFKNNLIYCKQRQKGGSGGSDCITAHTGKDANGDKGYVFEGCTLKSECGTVSLGRAWGDDARTYFLNTLVDYSAGDFSFTGSGIQRWTVSGINGNPKEFGEFNTHLENGTVLTPASNEVTFSKNGTVTMETVLSAEKAVALTMDYTLGTWAETAAADAKQAECEKEGKDFEPNAIYLAEAEGELPIIFKGSEFWDKIALYNGITYTIRKANARGGFGPQAGEESQATYLPSGTNEMNTKKIIRNGQLIIIRDGNLYNVLGAQL